MEISNEANRYFLKVNVDIYIYIDIYIQHQYWL